MADQKALVKNNGSGGGKAVWLAVALAVGFGLGQLSPQLTAMSSDTKDGAPNFSNLSGTYGLLKRKFDGTIDDKKILDGARAGLVSGAGDPYTVYLPPKAAKDLEDQLNGTLSGIGAEVGLKNAKLTVISPITGSPAEKAGLKTGDQIIAIDKKDTTGEPLDQAVGRIRGAADTKVTLKIVRGIQAPFDLTITRAVISVPSVKWSMKPGQIGYIQISTFGTDTTAKVQRAADELSAQGVKKIILDLRNDPGGYLTAAVDAAGQFLPAGKLVVEERHGGKSQDKQYTAAGGKLIGLPLIVLVNEGSASASEILAGALRDNGAAKLVGEKTFGKGSVQEITKLAGGGEVKVTVAHWYTPGGKNIDKEGIKPDIEVKQEQADYDAGRDPQLDRALQELQ